MLLSERFFFRQDVLKDRLAVWKSKRNDLYNKYHAMAQVKNEST